MKGESSTRKLAKSITDNLVAVDTCVFESEGQEKTFTLGYIKNLQTLVDSMLNKYEKERYQNLY